MKYISEIEEDEIVNEKENQVKPLSQLQQSLEALLYQYLNLHDRWAEERQAAVKNDAAFAKAVETTINEVKKLSIINTNLPNQISQTLNEVSNKITLTLHEASIVAADSQMVEVVGKLNKIFTKAEAQLRAYQIETVGAVWKMWIIALLSSLLTAGIFIGVLIPIWKSPTLPLSERQVKDMYRGAQIGEIWDKLSSKERKRLVDLMEKEQTS